MRGGRVIDITDANHYHEVEEFDPSEPGSDQSAALREMLLSSVPPSVQSGLRWVMTNPLFTFQDEPFTIYDPEVLLLAGCVYRGLWGCLGFCFPTATLTRALGMTYQQLPDPLTASLYAQRNAAMAIEGAGVLLVCSLTKDKALMRYVGLAQAVRSALFAAVSLRKLVSHKSSMWTLVGFLVSSYSAYRLGKMFFQPPRNKPELLRPIVRV